MQKNTSMRSGAEKVKLLRETADDPVLSEIQRPLSVVTEGIVFLKETLAGHKDPTVVKLLHSVEDNLKQVETLLHCLSQSSADRASDATGLTHFDMMQVVQQVMSSHDLLFLQKQLKYQVAASADIPKAYANPDKIVVVLSNLVSNAVKYSTRGSMISVGMKEVSLRQGAGVEFSIVNECENFSERDRFRIFETFYLLDNGERKGARKSSGLSLSRKIIQGAHGQLWVDVPEKGKVSFTVVLPCVRQTKGDDEAENHTFKYDIAVANYEQLKEGYGEAKAEVLLRQVEEAVRCLVRHPIDVVTAFEQSGVVSTIYETRRSTANSVATRISRQLGQAEFKIGKEAVKPEFRYHLSTLK